MIVQTAQDLRQLVRAELACSTAAVRVAGESLHHLVTSFRDQAQFRTPGEAHS